MADGRVELPGIKELADDVAKAKIEVRELTKAVLDFIAAGKGTNVTDTFKTDSPKKLSSSLKKLNDRQEQLLGTYSELEVARQQEIRTSKALQTQIAKNRNIRSQNSKLLAKERAETNILNKALREEALLNSKLVGAYQKLTIQRNKASRSLKDLVAGGKASRRELKKAERQFTSLDKRVRLADKSVGDFRRNVGNYPKFLGRGTQALRGLIGAFGIYSGLQIAREVFNQVKELDGLNKALQKVTGSAEEFAQSQAFLVDISERYGVEIRSTTKEYTKFLAGLKGTNLEGAKGIAIFEKVVKASSALGRSADETQGTLNALTQIISKGTVQAEELRGQLGDRLPGAFNIMARAIGVSVEELNDMLKKGEVLADEVLPKFADELIRTFGLENTDRIETMQAATNRLSNSWILFIQNIEGGEGRISKFFIFLIDSLAQAVEGFGLLFQSAEQLKASLSGKIEKNTIANTLKEIKENAKLLGTSEKEEAKIAEENAINRIERLKELIKFKEKFLRIRSNRTGLFGQESDGVKQAKEDVKDLNRQLVAQNAILTATAQVLKEADSPLLPSGGSSGGGGSTSRPRASAIESPTSAREGIIGIYDEQIKRVERLIELSNDESEIQHLTKVKDALKEQQKITKSGQDVTLAGQDEIAEGMQRYLDILKTTTEAEEDQNKKRIENLKKLAEALQLVDEFQNGIADLGSAIVERRIVALENEKDVVNENLDAQIQANEESSLSEAAKEHKRQLLEKEKERKNKEIDKRIKKEKTKQFRIDQIAAASQAAIQTALAVLKVTAQTGVGSPLVIPGIIALGALNTAAILAEPVPKFKDGTTEPLKKDTLAWTGDGGREEPIIKDGKLIGISPNKPTLTMLPKGAEVLPSMDDLIYNPSVLNQDMAGAPIINVQNDYQIDHKKLGEEIGNVIVEGIKNMPKPPSARDIGDSVGNAIIEIKYPDSVGL